MKFFYLFNYFLSLSAISYANAKVNDNFNSTNALLNKRNVYVDVAKKVLDLYNAYMKDNQNAILRNLRDYSDLQGDCAKSGCMAISGRNELSGDKGIYFAINNNNKQIAKCSVRNMTAGPMDYEQIDLGIRGEYPDFLIDMNGRLVCGCYDKNNNWKEINNVRYVHIYGFKEHNGVKLGVWIKNY